jgi:hypothetical protein
LASMRDINAMNNIAIIILFAKSDSFIISLFLNNFFGCYFLSLNLLNGTLIAAPTPDKEKNSSNQGFVPNKPSRYLPSMTPTITDAAIVTPISEKLAKARKVSLFVDCLSLLRSLVNIASSWLKNTVP